ncbi:MAG TPA: phosphomannose isomerase type II C-terminal cupin domain [Verrucomicrobiae bacterium]|nr:phosphomannose isomerase type II C-terminal cupin domain [Verrucomicrobiae bacterium]
MKNHVSKPIPDEKHRVGLVERPWGCFKQYALNQDCTVSLMTVSPGQRLSLQSHTGRAELWIIMDDGARVQVGDAERDYRAGDEIWIAVGEKHRLSCVGAEPVRVLEVAFGNWQQEDITRYSDDYARA